MKNKLLTFLFIFGLPFTSIAKPVTLTPLTTPEAIKIERVNKFSITNSAIDEILIKAIEDVDQLALQLKSAQSKLDTTNAKLNAVTNELTRAVAHADTLQLEINKETDLLNNTRKELNDQIADNQKIQKALDITKDKLNFWHKIVAGISVIVVIYGIFLVLKVMGKI